MTDSPIYQQLADERLVDVPEYRPPAPDDGPALAMLGPDGFDAPALDEQSIAFRRMSAADAVPDAELAAMAERVHPPYVPGADVRPASVEEYEAAGWDAGRTDPRP